MKLERFGKLTLSAIFLLVIGYGKEIGCCSPDEKKPTTKKPPEESVGEHEKRKGTYFYWYYIYYDHSVYKPCLNCQLMYLIFSLDIFQRTNQQIWGNVWRNKRCLKFVSRKLCNLQRSMTLQSAIWPRKYFLKWKKHVASVNDFFLLIILIEN